MQIKCYVHENVNYAFVWSWSISSSHVTRESRFDLVCALESRQFLSLYSSIIESSSRLPYVRTSKDQSKISSQRQMTSVRSHNENYGTSESSRLANDHLCLGLLYQGRED